MSKTILTAFIFFLVLHLTAQVLNVDSFNVNQLKLKIDSKGHYQQVTENSTGKSFVFGVGLWMSALDSNQQLSGSFQTYRFHNAEWNCGPISSNPASFSMYNHVWKINKTMVDSFVAGYYGNAVPAPISSWPAHGNTAFAESFYLAPFVDVNGNGAYNPAADGDYPCFPGDQAVFFMFNDDTTHFLTNSTPLGVEVLGLVYGYKQNTFLDSVMFVNYTIRNKRHNFLDFNAAFEIDFDLGNAADDISGTFVDQNTMYCYNSDSLDQGLLGFGLNPPATGVVVLNGIATNKLDGIDNDKDGCLDGVRDANGVCQPIDVANNRIEYWKLSNSMQYNNTSNSVTGNPAQVSEFRNYMTSFWRDGSPLLIDNPSGYLDTANGDGFVPSGMGDPSRYIYPGNSFDTSGAFAPVSPANWFQSPWSLHDKRDILGLGNREVFNVGEEVQFKLAFYYAWDTTTSNSIDAAYSMAKKINAYVDSVPVCSGSRLVGVEENAIIKDFKLFPNPAKNKLSISSTQIRNTSGEIYSYDGRKVLEFKLDGNDLNTLDISELPSGLYVIRIENKSERFVIAR